MKKTFTYFRTLATLLFAGAMTFSCALNEEPFNEPDQPVMDGPKVYTLTITAGNAATKALNVDGNTGKLSATWGANDQIQVVKGSTSLGYLDVQNITDGGKTASFSGSLSEAVAPNDELVLWYNNKGYTAFGNQDGALDGTLNSAAEYDCAKAAVTVVNVDNGLVTIKDKNTGANKADFETQTAVLKLNLTTDGTSPLNATKLTLAGSFTVSYFTVPHEIYSFTIPDATYVANGNGVLYFALPDKDDLADKVYDSTITIPGLGNVALNNYLTLDNIKEQLANTTITVTATCGGVNCTGSVSGYPFTKNNYYTATLTLTPPYYAAMNSDIGKVIATDGNIYANKAAAEDAGTSAEAMIAYVGKVEGVCKHGLAIELNDYSTSEYVAFDFSSANSYANGKSTIAGSTWRLPTDKDWQYMFWGTYYDTPSVTDISAFNSKLRTAGGKDLVKNSYWTNTSVNDETAKGILHDGTYVSFNSLTKTDFWYVRACLAF